MQRPYQLNRRKALQAMCAGLAALPVMSTPIRSFGLDNHADEDLSKVLPFAIDAQSTDRGRKVFAHWHVFPISFDNKPPDIDWYSTGYLNPFGNVPYSLRSNEFGGYQRERPLPRPPRPERDWNISDFAQDVRRAAAIGIDAFTFNIVTIDNASPLWNNLSSMLEATTRVDRPFKVIPNLDGSGGLKDWSNDNIADALRSVVHHPGVMRTPDGRVMLGSFYPEGWPVERWRNLFENLARSEIRISFLGIFLNFTRNANTEYLALTDIVSTWSGTHLGAIPGLAYGAAKARDAGKSWAAPVWPQDFRPREGWYAEAANSQVFREDWRLAIEMQSQYAHITTWNDYAEASEIQPSTGIQYSFYDLAAYYIAWFKSGKPPDIIRDVLYYFHRVEPTDGGAVGTKQSNRFELRFGRWPLNEIELLGFLTEPGQLEVEVGGRTTAVNAPAGIVSLRAPLAPGRPIFRLKRLGQEVISFASAFDIRTGGPYQDLLYRGGSSSRRPVQMLAEPFKE